MSVTTQLVLLAGIPSLFIAASALHSLVLFRRLGRKLETMSDKMAAAMQIRKS